MNPGDTRFNELLPAVMEEVATEAELAEFRRLLREDACRVDRYVRLLELHALLNCRLGASRLKAHRKGARTAWVWRPFRIAASAAALAVAAIVWGVWRTQPAFRADGAEEKKQNPSPIALVGRGSLSERDLPPALPGTLRLKRGAANVRLPSGVEMALEGPLELTVENDMEVRLDSGKLLAWVPPRASGFTVHAPGLTAWDIGTVFAVMAEQGRSCLFVFKGSVQTLDGEGEGLGICEAGQGVYAEPTRDPVLFEAESPASKACFAHVAGYAALSSPPESFLAVETIRKGERLFPAVPRNAVAKDDTNEGEEAMEKRTVAKSLALAGTLAVAGTQAATTWHVAPEGDDAAAGTSWEAPLKTISNAVAKAAIADEIVVSNGVYAVTAPISISKMLTVRALSANPRDTVIDGGGVTNCVAISATNVWFSGFTVTNAVGPKGAGIYAEFSKPGWLTLSNCVVTCCTSAKMGGGIGINVSVTNAIVTTVTDCEISHNVNLVNDTWNGGGGIFQGNDNGALTTRNCRIFGNRCLSGRGGGIFAQQGDVLDCEVYDNIAKDGGGVYSLHNYTATVGGCRIYNNAATVSAGGIACAKPLMTYITDCVVSNNVAPKGGGIAPVGSSIGFTVSNCLIVANQATNGSAGGVMYSIGRTRVFHSVIRGNMATTGGGGFYYSGQWAGTNESFVLNCLFEGNSVTGSYVNGGAILVNGGSNLLISACTVVANRSPQGSGGGIYLGQTTYGQPKILNTVFSGNTAQQTPARPDVNVKTDGDLNAFSYCFEANGLLPAAQDNVSGAPGFIDSDARNYRLTPDSPCYNAGTNELWMSRNRDLGITEQVTPCGPFGVRLVLNGLRRICGPKVDIGAYERFYPLGTVIQFQ